MLDVSRISCGLLGLIAIRYLDYYLPSSRQASKPGGLSSLRNIGSSLDVVIVVMGVIGSGKTSFIKTVIGGTDIEVGNSLFSGTLFFP